MPLLMLPLLFLSLHLHLPLQLQNQTLLSCHVLLWYCQREDPQHPLSPQERLVLGLEQELCTCQDTLGS